MRAAPEIAGADPPASTVVAVGDQQGSEHDGRPTPKDLWRAVLAIIGVVAVIQELRTPPEMRTWHGKVIGFVPYDFRKPTFERFRRTFWDPDGPLLPGKAWGVGWALNLGAVKRLLGR